MEENQESFISHLVELRDRLIRALVIILIIFLGLVNWAREIYTLLSAPMLAALPAGGADEVEVDLSGVNEIDTAGLQLMLQLKRKCGTRLRLVNHSPAVLQILDLSNLGAQFGDPVVLRSGEHSLFQS